MRFAFLLAVAMAGCGSSSTPSLAGTVNGCHTADFAATGTRIQYGEPLGLKYSPQCLSVSVGQQVTFFADTTTGANFSIHPLRPGTAPTSDPGSAGNPIVNQDTGSQYMVTFNTAGTYGYYCLSHESSGMYGAIQVK